MRSRANEGLDAPQHARQRMQCARRAAAGSVERIGGQLLGGSVRQRKPRTARSPAPAWSADRSRRPLRRRELAQPPEHAGQLARLAKIFLLGISSAAGSARWQTRSGGGDDAFEIGQGNLQRACKPKKGRRVRPPSRLPRSISQRFWPAPRSVNAALLCTARSARTLRSMSIDALKDR